MLLWIVKPTLIICEDGPKELSTHPQRGRLRHVCGVAPIPASFGKTTRHRLNRGGDRQANAALYRIVMRRDR
ncbi:hypothetical protein GCM10020001_001630 [Nonomuraea salmonea]